MCKFVIQPFRGLISIHRNAFLTEKYDTFNSKNSPLLKND